MTVAAYDAVLQEKKTIWTWHATPVAQLTPEPADSYQRVFDVEAYEAQMLRMLGLD